MSFSTDNSTLPTGDPLTPFPPPTVELALLSQPTPSDESDDEEESTTPARKLKRLDRRYTAGLIDGEGCFTILMSQTPHGHRYFTAVVQISSTDIHVLNCMKHSWGGSVGSNGKKRKRSKMTYKWRMTGENVAEFIREVGPYLIIKREVARTVLRFIRYRKLTSATQAGFMRYRRRVRFLNRVGTA